MSANSQLQWSWATRFWNLGASYDLDDKTRFLAQLMSGEALMGYPNGRSVWINIGYTSAYLLGTHSFGRSGVTGRIEYFETRDRNYRPGADDPGDNRGEHGWAALAAYRYDVSAAAQLRLEALHIHSVRPSLGEFGLAPAQRQTTVQTALRLSF